MKNTSYSTQLSVLEVSIVGTNMTKQTIQSNTRATRTKQVVLGQQLPHILARVFEFTHIFHLLRSIVSNDPFDSIPSNRSNGQ